MPHLPLWSDMTECSIKRKKEGNFDAPQISAINYLLLPVRGSIAFHGHHYVHLKDMIWFQHVLKSLRLALFYVVHLFFC